jgi:hypothetical protein
MIPLKGCSGPSLAQPETEGATGAGAE